MHEGSGSMRIAVAGIGGVGGYYGGMLARYYAIHDTIDVVFIARGEHLKQIQKNGLHLITGEGAFSAIPTLATDNPKDIGIFDLVLFCVKGYDLESCAELLKGNINEASIVISLLNGVDNAERLTHLLPGAKVLNGCVYISAHIAKPGVVRQTGGSCQLLFGAEDGRIHEFTDIETLLESANIQAELKQDIKTIVWEKYLFVSPLASATTYLGKAFGEIMADVASRRLLEGLMEEVALVAEAIGVEFSDGIIQESLNKISLFPYDTKSSMQLDFEKGKNTEIDTFTGYILTRGKELGINAPLHEKVYRKLLETVAV